MPITQRRIVTVKHLDGNLKFDESQIFPATKNAEGEVQAIAVQDVLYAVKDGEGEIVHSFTQSEMVGVHQETVVACEGPRCAALHNAAHPKTVAWDEQKAQQDPNEIPDDAYRFFNVFGFAGEKHVFCSVRCEHDWQLESYVPPRSPREVTEEMQRNAAVIKKPVNPGLTVVPPLEVAVEGEAQ